MPTLTAPSPIVYWFLIRVFNDASWELFSPREQERDPSVDPRFENTAWVPNRMKWRGRWSLVQIPLEQDEQRIIVKATPMRRGDDQFKFWIEAWHYAAVKALEFADQQHLRDRYMLADDGLFTCPHCWPHCPRRWRYPNSFAGHLEFRHGDVGGAVFVRGMHREA